MDNSVEITCNGTTYKVSEEDCEICTLSVLFGFGNKNIVLIEESSNSVARKIGEKFLVASGNKYKLIFSDDSPTTSSRT